jgi:hypothetical protein
MSIKVQGNSSFAFVAAASVVTACSQAAPIEGTDPTEPSSSSSDALNTVVGCEMADETCRSAAKSPADDLSCRQALQSCLMSLLPEAGAFAFRPARFDGGFPPPRRLQFPDGGFPRPSFPDAGFPRLQFPDGGFPRPPGRGFDAGLPVTPDGGATDQRACIDDLQRCLFSMTDPMTCASDARACLTAVAAAQCDEREKACVDAKRPQAICDAERRACR